MKNQIRYSLLAATVLTLFFMPNFNLKAQYYIYPANSPWRSSTLQEGILRGSGAYWYGKGAYLRNLGMYEKDHQNAYSDYLDNVQKRVDAYWNVKEQWKERNKHKTWIQRQEESFERSQKIHDLKLKEEQLIKEGVLAPKKTPKIVYQGKEYNNYAEFKKSNAWIQMKSEVRQKQFNNQIENERNQLAHLHAVAFSVFWDRLSHSQRNNYKTLSQNDKFNLYNNVMYGTTNQNNSFYEIRPYLIPTAGKNGLPSYQ